MSEAIEALEGSILPIDCLDDSSACSKAGGCAQREMWQAVRAAILGVLENTTIADLAAKDRAVTAGGARYVI